MPPENYTATEMCLALLNSYDAGSDIFTFARTSWSISNIPLGTLEGICDILEWKERSSRVIICLKKCRKRISDLTSS